MRIACLQFSPELGKVSENIIRVNNILHTFNPENLDLLVLPELALTGYNYPSLPSILPHLEPTATGPSTTWAKTTAARLKCIVTVGYPELYTPSPTSSISLPSDEIVAYNSTITISPTGQILAHYRKTHLYYTDETWAQESPEGWLSTPLTFIPKTGPEKSIKASFGICMDLNPYRFTAPWTAYEFLAHAQASESEILILSMAWLTNQPSSELAMQAREPDLDTLSYWIERLKPLVEGDKEVVIVCANRCGEEEGKNSLGVEEGVRYAGTSWSGKVGREKVKIWDIMGRREEGVTVVDTEEEPQWTLRMQPQEKDYTG